MLSIITPCLNRAAFIRQAVESARRQDYAQVEHIVVDGGSTDGTLEILASYPNLHVVSGTDRGVYDALNKGIAISKGELIGQLNTDDYYQPDIFKKITDLFAQNPDVDAVCGSARVFETDSEYRERDVAVYEPIGNSNFPARITAGVPIFNAWFFRRRVFERIGSYSLDYPLLADRDFLIRCYLGGLQVLPVDSVVYNYRRHGGSLTINAGYSVSLLREARQLSKACLKRSDLDSAFKKRCVAWHDLKSIEMLIWYAQTGNLSGALNIAPDAIKINPLWPLIFAGQIPVRLINYIRKHYVTHG